MTQLPYFTAMLFGPTLTLIGLFLFHQPSSAETPINHLSDAEQRSGWQLLFDGESTDQWRNYQKETISPGWQIIEGALTRNQNGAGDIITRNKYRNFELSLEYRISKGGNSGIMFHVSEDEKTPWRTGPEIQVQDNVDGHDPQKAGWLYQLYAPTKRKWISNTEKKAGIQTPDIPDATRPAGEWNQIFMRISSQQSQVLMNGVSYYSFVKGSQDWNERVAKSKFSKFPEFGKNEEGFICLQDHGNLVSYRNIKIRVLDDQGKVRNPVDGQAKVKAVVAFPKLTWEGWQGVNEDTGKSVTLRPINLTHANDQSGRIFVGTQRGAIHVFPNDPDCEKTKLFLDLTAKTRPFKSANEEGLLGLAFHPDYKETGYFYVYYSPVAEKKASYVSRFSVSKDNPNRADPASEEVLMKIDQPFVNHNGGSIAFGKDGYLYIGMGDGGLANDPYGNGQDLGNFHGCVLRIDVDSRAGDRKYGIPSDNPFIDRKGALPEIYAYGFRNVWRLTVDSKTGDIWIGDVGQDLWEEVNLLKAGGNYGWSLREGDHPFGNRAASNPEQPIAPVWEYDHLVGKSITGGIVHRGKAKQLYGSYLYADYVSGKAWALQYDQSSGKVIRNLSVPTDGMPIMAFGEDANGEAYFMGGSTSGTSIFRFEDTQ